MKTLYSEEVDGKNVLVNYDGKNFYFTVRTEDAELTEQDLVATEPEVQYDRWGLTFYIFLMLMAMVTFIVLATT